MRLTLASGSPRRKDLLAKMGFVFDIYSPDVDETVDGKPIEMVRKLAIRKGRFARPAVSGDWLIAADSLVALDGRALGKPEDEAAAFEMLKSLSGREHSVVSGVCLIEKATGRECVFTVRSGVQFREISPGEIRDYIATGEPMDKAGSYAIQGIGGKFVSGYTGSYDNIVGLPTEALWAHMVRLGIE